VEEIIMGYKINDMSKNKNWMIISAMIVAVAGGVSGIALWLHRQGSEKTPLFLPGVYICVAQNEFCRIDDTLVIRRNRLQEDNYSVTRTTSFVRIREGKKDFPEYQQRQWNGEYQVAKCRLISSNEADTVLYYPDRNRVSKAGFYYEKIE